MGTEHVRATMAGQAVDVYFRVTNIDRKEEGRWKVVHHHTDLSPAMLDVLSRVQAQTQESVS